MNFTTPTAFWWRRSKTCWWFINHYENGFNKVQHPDQRATLSVKTLDQFDIAGRSAIVTGAASGICTRLCRGDGGSGREGRRSPTWIATPRRSAKQRRCVGSDVKRVQTGSTSPTAQPFAKVFDDHTAECASGSTSAFANAGIDPSRRLLESGRPPRQRQPPRHLRHWGLGRTMAIDLTSRDLTIREAARLMKKHSKGGSIIATSSNAALVCEPMVGSTLRYSSQGGPRPLLGPPCRSLSRRISHPRECDARPAPPSPTVGGGSAQGPGGARGVGQLS